MAIRSSRGGAFGRVSSPLIVAGTVVLLSLLATGTVIDVPSAVPLPVVFGLAARGGTDRGGVLERLATELESFVSDVRDDEADPGAGPRPASTDFELDRDDELGRLSAAIDELTTTVRERERRFTERERELREAHEQLEAIIEASPVSLITMDLDGTVERWNPAAERIFGWREDEVVGEPLPIVPEDRLDEHRTLVERQRAGETLSGVETKRRTKDGELIDVRISGAPIRNGEGEIVGTIGAPEDVTERKERERRLETTSARLEALFEHSPDMVNVLDTEGRIVEANRRLCAELGYAEEELIGTAIWEYDREFDADRALTLLDGLTVGERRRFESHYERRDGSSIPIEVHLIRLDLDDEDRFLAINRDITDRKADERRLRDRERELQRYKEYTDDVLDAIDDVFYVLDEEGDLQRWNAPLAAVSGYSPAEIESMHALEFFAEADRPAVSEAIEEALETGSARLEVSILTADGESIPYEFVASRLEDLDGNVVVAGIGRDISERRRYERDLERTTELLEQAQRIAGVGGWELDVRTEPYEATATDEFYRQLGLDPGTTLTAADATEQFHPDDRPALEAALDGAIEDGEGYDFEARVRRADGDPRWVRAIGEPLREDGRTVAVRGSMQDVTDRKRRERELERYEGIVQAIGDPVYTLDPSGEISFVNDAIESLVGYDPETVIGSDVSELLPPDDLERARDVVRDLLRGDEPYETVETQFVTADDEVVETETHVALLTGEDGEFAGTAGVVRDITERKERERELERYETIVQAVGDPVYTLDESGEFRFINDAIEPLTGYEPETLIGKNVEDVMTSSNLETARELIRDLLQEEKPYAAFEMDLLTTDGEIIEAENHMALLPKEDGEFAGTAGVIRDITERKERERELERTTDLLERVQRMASVGGWELDVDPDPRTAIWTDEMYRLHDLSRGVAPDLEQTVECYHPDDQPFVREQLRTAIEAETGYDFEARLRSDDGDVRWVRSISEPILDEDGELRKYRGTVQDISDRKRRELALKSLHETARGLLNAETESTVADLVVETAADLHGRGSAALYLLDGDTNRFEPTASTADFDARFDGAPSIAVGDGDSVLWNTYVTGTQTVVDDAAIGDGSPLFGADVPGGLLVPIGDYGVFVLLASPATIDDETRQLFETLVATTEAAFDRLESEASLRERDAELAARNRRLRRQIQITDIIRGIDRSLIGAEGRAEIERTVPERLVEADNVTFAWIGAPDASGSTLEPRTWAGDEPEYLDALDLDLEGDSAEPSVRTARSETPTVVENVVDGLQRESWRPEALDADFQSVVSVPIRFEEYSYGVLSVYADEPDAFTDLERTVFAELAEGIANAITAAKTREALHTETLVELTLELEGDDVLSRIAAATGATATYEGLGTDSDSETVLFFETSGASAADVRETLDDLVSVTASRLITESDGDCLFEATVTGDVVASRLVRHGGSPRSITAAGERTEIVVDVPPGTDVREFVEMLGDRYENVELQSRRHVQRAMHTRQELVTSLFDDLTDRQLEVLRTAYLAGFFEWPRESTGEEIAEMLEVTQPTVNRHLRIGQQRLLSQLFATERLAPIETS